MWYLRWVGSWKGQPIHRCSGTLGKHRLKVRRRRKSTKPHIISMECRHCSRAFWFSDMNPEPK